MSVTRTDKRLPVILAALSLAWFSACRSAAEPVKVILDTDPSSDPDDVGCLAMLHTLASRGECEILAVVNSIDHKEGSLAISAINGFYNRGAIPVGDYKGYARHHDAPADLYSHHLAESYPRALADYRDAIDSVALYREVLANAEPHNVTVIVIGTMHNLAALLQSDACEHSPLSGIDLVRDKVRQVVAMGGNFIDGAGHDRTNWGGADALCGYTEWSCLNASRNELTRYVIEHCPAPLVASGWEVGCGDYHDAQRGNVMTGQGLKALPEGHIARASYEYHFAHRGGAENIDRHSNDQCALHYAIRGEGDNYEAFLDGAITLTQRGACAWTADRNRRQGYIQKKRDPEAIAAEIEALMLGDVPPADTSKPNAPTGLVGELRDGEVHLTWDAATDPTPGSWVVAYHVYRDAKRLRIAYGTRFRERAEGDVEPSYVVRAVNPSGQESEGVVVAVRPDAQ